MADSRNDQLVTWSIDEVDWHNVEHAIGSPQMHPGDRLAVGSGHHNPIAVWGKTPAIVSRRLALVLFTRLGLHAQRASRTVV